MGLSFVFLPNIGKSEFVTTYLNFDSKCYFDYFKSQISKCPTQDNIKNLIFIRFLGFKCFLSKKIILSSL